MFILQCNLGLSVMYLKHKLFIRAFTPREYLIFTSEIVNGFLNWGELLNVISVEF